MSHALWSGWMTILTGIALVSAIGCGGGGGGTTPPVSVPAISSVSPSGAAGATGTSVTFSVTATNSPTAFSWNFGGGASPNTASTSNPTVTLGATGSYTGSVTASNTAGTSAAFTFAFTVGAAPGRTVLGSDTFDGTGGTATFGDLTITAGPGDVISPITFEVAELDALPVALPSGATSPGDIIDIDMNSGADAIEIPLLLGFDGLTIPTGSLPLVLHLEDGASEWEPTTVLDFDRAAGTVLIESRAFSTFVPVVYDAALLPDEYTNVLWDTPANGWSIANFGSYFSPGGNCLGMAAYACWFWKTQITEDLATKYTGTAAEIVATRAFLAQSQQWAVRQFDDQRDALAPEEQIDYFRLLLSRFERPITMILFGPASAHACVAVGYTEDHLVFYDVNTVGVNQQLEWAPGLDFGTYNGFDRFSLLTRASLGRNIDFQSLYDDAENGFDSGDITIIRPTPLEVINERKTILEGTVANSAWDHLSVFVNGVRYDNPIVGGAFNIEIPLSPGENPITLVAGVGIDSQAAWFRSSGTAHIVVENELAEVAFLVTTTWQQNNTDVDTYVTEPDGQTSWFGEKTTDSGGALDIDDTDGFGPEHYTIGATVQPGVYAVRLHYYSDHGTDAAATGVVSILLDEGLPTQRLESRPYRIGESDSATSGPGGAGPAWINIATVDVENRAITWQL